ncbi:MAG: UDP-N-acetylmuramoyl-tripeptide--D-alanyl-D-alanine ligase [Proteobacteria bacterium]|nr:UDP-N-acetylmuramoyl-tripeptide--D-alanyl-D-alanine ligase [Pseudomonadota bacterium]
MRPLALGDIARWCEARLLAASRDGEGDVAAQSIDAVAIDTRKLDRNDGRRVLFVALRGENHDAHDHLDAAIAGGAAALLLAHETDTDLPQLLCGDTQQALGDLAAGVQQGRAAKVLALTGSNGKTSVKTLLLGICERAGRAYANPGNRNNEIGLPLAVLDAPEDAQYAIYEMGAGKPGDIAYLASIARPDVALVNNIMPAHLERMGSLLGVAQTKGAIFEALPEHGVAAINADDAFAPYFETLAGARRVLRFGLEASADISARAIRVDGESSHFELVTSAGNAAIALPLPGRHNVMNALAATAMALGAGIGLEAIRDGLNHARPVPGRQIAHTLASGVVLIDDSYNANPGSVQAAIAALAAGGGEAWLVLGDMAELGESSAALHAQVGASARANKIARLYATGAHSRATAQAFGSNARHYADQTALIAALRADLHPGVRVLVKGSRSSAMDKVVAALLAAVPSDSASTIHDSRFTIHASAGGPHAA